MSSSINTSLYSCCLCFTKQGHTLYPGSQTMEIFGLSIVTFETEITLPQKTAIESKRLHPN